MTDELVDLDLHRSEAGKIATEIRRHSHTAFEADQQSRRDGDEELAAQLIAKPAQSWPEAAAKAGYLLRRYAMSADAQDARRKTLVERVLLDLARLTREEENGQ